LRILALTEERDSSGSRFLIEPKDLIFKHIEDLTNPAKRSETINTGFHAFDSVYAVQPGEMIVLASRPKLGKTNVLCNLALNTSGLGNKTLVISTEMRFGEMANKFLSITSGIRFKRFRTRDFLDGHIGRISKAASKISELPLVVMDRFAPTLDEIRAATSESKASVVIVDYLGQCTMTESHSRAREIEIFAQCLKKMCLEKRVVCFLAVQLNRRVEATDEKPRLSDLADSSGIEKAADAVLGMWENKDAATQCKGVKIINAASLGSGTRNSVGMEWMLELREKDLLVTEMGHVPKVMPEAVREKSPSLL